MPKNLNFTHPYLRRDFFSDHFLEKNVARHPMDQFKIWFEESVKQKIPDANAFTLATADSKNNPTARVLLMKGFNQQGITFFTHYQSAKGKAISQNSKGAAVFFWSQLNRQIRLEGNLIKLSRKESLDYFQSRPLLAQIAACISKQSQMIASRAELERKFEELKNQLKNDDPDLPPDWGGYLLKIKRVEFWQGQKNRLHDRLVYQKISNRWKLFRLQP